MYWADTSKIIPFLGTETGTRYNTSLVSDFRPVSKITKSDY